MCTTPSKSRKQKFLIIDLVNLKDLKNKTKNSNLSFFFIYTCSSQTFLYQEILILCNKKQINSKYLIATTMQWISSPLGHCDLKIALKYFQNLIVSHVLFLFFIRLSLYRSYQFTSIFSNYYTTTISSKQTCNGWIVYCKIF